MKDETDGFLSRWSRRKADAKADDASRQERVEAEAGAGEAEAGSVEAVEPDFDVSTLPSIESLTKDSDFTVFLQKGVPTPLKKAALHKMWMTDPAIRDYIGLSEMSWDFNAPEAFPGYGALSPLAKVADMVRNIANGPLPSVSDSLEAVAEEAGASESPVPEVAPAEEKSVHAPFEDDAQSTLIQKDTESTPFRPKRRHGGAIPR